MNKQGFSTTPLINKITRNVDYGAIKSRTESHKVTNLDKLLIPKTTQTRENRPHFALRK